MKDIRTLNQAILSLAPRFEARAVAPGTLADLYDCAGHAGLIVYDGASDTTLYGCARVNLAFRAWHDALHLAHGFTFDLEGERQACTAQVRALLKRFPSAPAWALNLIRAEIEGQAEHFAAFGYFPENQAAFVAAYVQGH